MGVVIVCSALLLAGVAATVRWRSLDIRLPGPSLEAGAPVGAVARRYVWWVAVAFYTAILTAVTIVGPMGRLAMRVLAVTGGAEAQGRVTDAGEIVGRVTVGGTVGLFIFVGLLFGGGATVGYFLVRRWLPSGLAGGACYGAALLVLFGTRADPLRENNIDFDIVGPGWLAIVIYATMAVVTGMAIAAFAGRLSRWIPELSKRPSTLLVYMPAVLPFVAGPPGFAVDAVLVLTLLLSRSRVVVDVVRSRGVVIAGRLALVIVVAVTLPATLGALADIAGRP